MTDQEIARYIDIDRIPEYMSGPSRDLVEYVASCQEAAIKEMKARLEDVTTLVEEENARLEKLKRNRTPAKTEKEFANGILNGRLRLLKSAKWIIVSQHTGQTGPKCGCCDDEGMLTFTAPDGQTVKRPCRCRDRRVLTYRAAEARWMKVDMTGVTLRLCEGLCEDDPDHPEYRISFGMVDPDDDVLEGLPRHRISDIAFTTREKAEAAIRKMRLNEEDVNA